MGGLVYAYGKREDENMSKTYESMSLKEVFLAGKKAGIMVPIHLRSTDTAHDPKLLEEARQYLVSQLNALYIKRMVQRTFWVAVSAMVLSALLVVYFLWQYIQQHRAASQPPAVSYAYRVSVS